MLLWAKRAKRSLVALVSPSSVKPIPAASLLGLPTELIEHIVSFLSAAETASLSLCNKQLCLQLGIKERWTPLGLRNEDTAERAYLLTLLARQNPKIFCCHNCFRLHYTAIVGPAVFRYLLPRWLRCPRRTCHSEHNFDREPVDCFEIYKGDISAFRLTFEHVQLAMARHRHGSPFGISLDFLSLTEVQGTIDEGIKLWFLFNAEPRIRDNELLLRVQLWTVISLENPPDRFKAMKHNVCLHVRDFPSLPLSDMHESPERCGLLRRCTKCGVEFEFQIRYLGDGRQACIITKWLNFGDGSSPSERNWRSHLPTWRNRPRARIPVALAPEISSLKARFEGSPGRSLEDALHANVGLLYGDSYRKRLRNRGESEFEGAVWLSI